MHSCSFTCVQSKGYTIGHVYISKHLLFGIFPIKNPEKLFSWCFPFALKHCECDSQLPVHFRLSTTPVSFLVHVCPLRVAGPVSLIDRCVMRCSYYKCVQWLRLLSDSVCSAVAAHAVL